MGSIADARAELEAVLVGAGIAIGDVGLPPTPPVALVRPADPWIVPASVGGGAYELGLSVLLVAGQVGLPGTVAALEALAQAAIPAIAGLIGWSSSPASRASVVEIAGEQYLVAELKLSTLIEL